MRLQVKVTASMLNIRKSGNASSKITGLLRKNNVVNVTKLTNGWYYLEDKRGWFNKKYVKTVKNLETKKTPKPSTKKTTKKAASTKTSYALDTKLIKMLYDSVNSRQKKIDASTRLFGAPFQFIQATDFRIQKDQYKLGRKYMENIISESPIVYFMPGKPNYLPDLTESERKTLTNFFGSKKVDSQNKSALDNILKGKDARYFGFLADYATYMRYVNLLCRVSAMYMGLGKKTAPNSTKLYKYYDWSNYRYEDSYKKKESSKKSVFDLSALKTDMYESLFGSYQYTQYYADASSSFNESSNNNTAESKIANAFESASGIVKELSFFTNTMAIKSANTFQESFTDGMTDINEKLLKNGNENFFTRLLGMSSQVLSGSNVVFPEIWGDSAYNKSYNVGINLVSPYGDKESIYLNIIVPLMHLLALTLPRQSTANSFSSPFLVKVFSKGWFSCEMGIIDNISIDKGGSGSWSIDGLPTEVKVNISVKDLYSNLMVTPNSSPMLFFENQGLIEFLAVSCGIDLTKPQFQTKVEAIFATLYSSIKDIPANLARDFIQDIRNSLEGLYKF